MDGWIDGYQTSRHCLPSGEKTTLRLRNSGAAVVAWLIYWLIDLLVDEEDDQVRLEEVFFEMVLLEQTIIRFQVLRKQKPFCC